MGTVSPETAFQICPTLLPKACAVESVSPVAELLKVNLTGALGKS
jgi:hypothetical protein